MSNHSLQDKIRLWTERFEALSLRERLLFLISVIAVLYMGWDMVLMERVRAQQKTALVQMKKWQSQITEIDQRIQLASATLAGGQQNQAMQRITQLKSEISDITQRQKALAGSFIRPRQMVDVLKGLLATERGLQLTRLQSQAVQPLIYRMPAGTPSNAPLTPELAAKIGPNTEQQVQQLQQQSSESATAISGGAALPQVYKHGLEIVFQGDYNSTLSYLRKLEQLPWKFYWEEVVYEVLDYPKAQILVRIHTLSLDKGWISV